MKNVAINKKEFVLGSLTRTTTQGFFNCSGWDKDPYQRNLLVRNSYPLNS